MQLKDIEANVEALDLAVGFDLIFDLLLAYGLPKATITKLRKGINDLAKRNGEVLLKQKVWYRHATSGEDAHELIDHARGDERITRAQPRFLIVQWMNENVPSLLAVDTRTGGGLDVPLAGLPANLAFFLPWAGIEKTQLENINYADRKAAEKMAVLYDEITKHNQIETDDDVRALNIFFSRLLFCFFAEDTGVFVNPSTPDGKGLFTNTLASLTRADGSDTAAFLDDLFDVLDTEPTKRSSVPAHFVDFDYVNGKLFANDHWTGSPSFSPKARRIILECATLDWSEINPDIFGSMIQAVVKPGQRENLGMHYTSVENIMKVIRPLFLDGLHEAFHAADTVRKLDNLLDRIAAIKFFDPACGSGNFLIIAYKELRKLEHRILQRQVELDPTKARLFVNSRIHLDHFYGIEIDDFAHEIAILSLYLAKHQMNVEFHELFKVEIPLIPLRDTGHITCANAARLDWNEACPAEDGDEVYVLGNPPYLGGTKRSDEQTADLLAAFGDAANRYLDYISIWFIKGARFVVAHNCELGFVTTNSVVQGNHVALLWPHVRRAGAEVSFAYPSFRWTNNAKGNAGVSVAIIGLAPKDKRAIKPYYDGSTRREVKSINFYLVPDGRDVIVEATDESLNGFPKLAFGSMPRDGGNLLLTKTERDELISQTPAAAPFIRRYIGANEFLNGGDRFCIWVPEVQRDIAFAIPALAKRFDKVRAMRAASKAVGTRKAAATPHLFVQRAHQPGGAIVVPFHTSERRDYIPFGFVDEATVVSNAAGVAYGASPWRFALIQSRLHMAWVRSVGGTLGTSLRYSASLCYNTFPVPPLTDSDKESLTEFVFEVLEARERHTEKTLAQLYDPDKMPIDLRHAHERLDEAVEQMYRARPFESDDERLEHLFDLYEAAVRGAMHA